MPRGWRDESETVVVIPDLSHTGIRTILTDNSGGNIGKNLRNTVMQVYPAEDQRVVKSLYTKDMSQPISTASRTIRQLQKSRSPKKVRCWLGSEAKGGTEQQ
jgi:hypothetical protein